MKKKLIGLSIKLSVLAISVLLLLRIIDPNVLVENIKKVPPSMILLATFIGLIRNWFSAVRWKIINIDTSNQLKTWDYFRYTMIGGLFNILLPGALGGDLVKSAYMANEVQNYRSKNIISILFDRLVGFASVFFLGIIMLNFSTVNLNKTAINLTAVLLLITGIFLIWVIKNYDPLAVPILKNAENKILKFILNFLSAVHESVHYYINYPRKIMKAFLICFPIHFSWLLIVYLFAIGLEMHLTFADIAMSSTIIWFITAIPISIGGLGIREISHVLILSKFGIIAEKAVSLSLYQFVITIIISLLGLPFLLTKKKKIIL